MKRLKNLILGAQLWPRRQCIHYAASGDAGSVVSKRLVPDEGKQAGQPAFSWLPRRSGAFEPASFGDRYQDALRELVEAKTKGLATTPRAIAEPPKVINLMEASKRNVARGAEPEPKKAAVSKPTRAKAVPDRRQRALLLPAPGGREKKNALVAEPAASTAPKRRKKAG